MRQHICNTLMSIKCLNSFRKKYEEEEEECKEQYLSKLVAYEKISVSYKQTMAVNSQKIRSTHTCVSTYYHR